MRSFSHALDDDHRVGPLLHARVCLPTQSLFSTRFLPPSCLPPARPTRSLLSLPFKFSESIISCCDRSGLILSGIETSRWFQDFRFRGNDNWEESHIIVAVLLSIATLLMLVYHFAEAWRTLPGAYYVSGNVNINIVIKENLVSGSAKRRRIVARDE